MPVLTEMFSSSSTAAPRFGEISKLLPVGVVLAMIVILYMEYVFLHCLRLLQLDLPPEQRKQADAQKGLVQLFVFHVVTALMLYCFGRCILEHPGTIPDNAGWDLSAGDEDLEVNPTKGTVGLREKKTSGERRHCKWCLKFKPDRCHHCRVCNICVLKMDHHCPWVYNCIGFRNHKFFFLLVLYAVIDLIFINATMFDSVWWSTRVDVSLNIMLILTFGETLATFLVVLTFCFLLFHIWLMSRAMTTVEFCEKMKTSHTPSVYSVGMYGNICAVLGPRMIFWLLPISFPTGDGLTWGKESTPLLKGKRRSSAGSGGSGSGGPSISHPPAEDLGESSRPSLIRRASTEAIAAATPAFPKAPVFSGSYVVQAVAAPAGVEETLKPVPHAAG